MNHPNVTAGARLNIQQFGDPATADEARYAIDYWLERASLCDDYWQVCGNEKHWEISQRYLIRAACYEDDLANDEPFTQ